MVDYDAIGDDNPSIARSYFTPEGSIVIMCDITISFGIVSILPVLI